VAAGLVFRILTQIFAPFRIVFGFKVLDPNVGGLFEETVFGLREFILG
jgi:hypothetical protein